MFAKKFHAATFVTLSELDEPLSSAAGKSRTGAPGATESNVIANVFDNPDWFPAKSMKYVW